MKILARSPIPSLRRSKSDRLLGGRHCPLALALALAFAAAGLPAHGGAYHHAPKAKRAIYLFMSGAPSQIDLWDHKPKMRERYDEDLPDSIRDGQRLTTMTSGQSRFPVAPSIYEFARHGQCGTEVSELLPHTAKMVDNNVENPAHIRDLNATILHLLGIHRERCCSSPPPTLCCSDHERFRTRKPWRAHPETGRRGSCLHPASPSGRDAATERGRAPRPRLARQE